MDDSRSTIRPDGGLETRPGSKLEGFSIPSDSPTPQRTDPRYNLSPITLGQMERLAKARFELRQAGLVSDDFDPNDEDAVRSIAMTVFASSDIEGEGFGAENLHPFVAALTEPGEHVDNELKDRMRSFRDQYDAYLWALTDESEDPLSLDFVLELHKRMFQKSKPAIAGRLKEKPVVITYGHNGHTKTIETVPHDKAEEYLVALCNRVNEHFRLGAKGAKYSMFLAAAEFQCDFLAIHPFADGNGRTSRLLTTYLLERGGYHFARVYPIDQVVLDTRREYYDALFQSQQNWHTEQEDLSPWLRYFTDCVFEVFERALRRVERNRAGH